MILETPEKSVLVIPRVKPVVIVSHGANVGGNAGSIYVSATNKVLGRATAGAGPAEELDCTSFGRSLIDDANDVAAAATLGLSNTADDTKGDALIGFKQANSSGFVTGAVATTVSKKLQDFLSLKGDFGAVGDGVVNDAAAIQAAMDYASARGETVRLPAGVYYLGTTGLILKNNSYLEGAGSDYLGAKGTVLIYWGTDDAIKTENPINASTLANIHIKNLCIVCAVQTTNKAALADRASTRIWIENVATHGNEYGIILDQSELAVVENCHIENYVGATAGLWITNGSERTPGANQLFTNRVTVKQCQFHGTDGHGIVDDGGVTHVFKDNNFYGLQKQARFSGVSNLSVTGMEMEIPGVTCIEFATTKHGGGAGTPCSTVKMDSNFMVTGSALPLVTFANTNAVKSFNCQTNEFNNQHASGSPFSGLTTGCIERVGIGNFQTGISTADVGNTYNVAETYTVTWTAAGSAPSIGNGTLTGSYSRNGNTVVVSISLNIGSTTNLGAGAWSFSLPFTGVNAATVAGSCEGLIPGVKFVAGAVQLTAGNNKVQCVNDGNTNNQFTGTEPGPWGANSYLNMSITMPIGKGV
jgi:hypothetical protein